LARRKRKGASELRDVGGYAEASVIGTGINVGSTLTSEHSIYRLPSPITSTKRADLLHDLP
jgi:hypothetical protein